MNVNLNIKEKELLVNELEETTIPDLRVMIASGMKKELRDELKHDEEVLKGLLEKLKIAA